MPRNSRYRPDKEARTRQRWERLGTDSPKCAICGLTDPTCLEYHHLSGRRHGDEGVILCRNHHAVLSDAQRDHPTDTGLSGDPWEAFGRFLLGLADLLSLVIAKLKEIGEALIDRARADEGALS